MQGQADFNYNDFQDGQQRELDKKMYVKFLYREVVDQAASQEAGRTIMVEKEFIHMMNPGSEPVCKPATDYYRQRFAAHYEAFKNRVAPPESGTPLSLMPYFQGKETTLQQLAFKGVKTVEQLADLNDEVGSQIMGYSMFKKEAQNYMEYMKEAKEYGDKKKLAEENEALKEGMKQLQERIEALEKKPAKKKPAARKRKPAKKKSAAKKKE